jgi:hypothetical protein
MAIHRFDGPISRDDATVVKPGGCMDNEVMTFFSCIHSLNRRSTGAPRQTKSPQER